MNTYKTYGMAGIGIAVAIGFVFSLTILSNNIGPGINLQNDNTGPGSSSDLQRQTTLPSNDSGSGLSTFANQRQETSTGLGASGANLPESAQLMSKAENESASAPLMLTSITVSNENRQLIGDLVPDMKFDLNHPVFIDTSFANNNVRDVIDHKITMILRKVTDDKDMSDTRSGSSSNVTNSNNEYPLPRQDEDVTSKRIQPDDQITTFRGNVSANSMVELQLLWTPNQPGQYDLILFSMTSADEEFANPLSVIPVIVEAN